MSNVVNNNGSFAKPRYCMDAMWVGKVFFSGI